MGVRISHHILSVLANSPSFIEGRLFFSSAYRFAGDFFLTLPRRHMYAINIAFLILRRIRWYINSTYYSNSFVNYLSF